MRYILLVVFMVSLIGCSASGEKLEGWSRVHIQWYEEDAGNSKLHPRTKKERLEDMFAEYNYHRVQNGKEPLPIESLHDGSWLEIAHSELNNG